MTSRWRQSRRALPAGAVRALVVTGGERLPATVAEAWDLCLTTRPGAPPIHGRPFVGWAAVDGARTLFTVLDVRARSRQFERIEEAIADASGRRGPGSVKASVVIAAGDDPGLERAVAAAARQTFDRESYEVLVVGGDPGGSGLGARIERLRAAHFSGRPDRLRSIRCPLSGPAHLRNAGISEARGEIVCFLEDGGAEPSWIETAWRSLGEDPDSGAMLPSSEPLHDTSAIEAWTQGAHGANWAARRRTLLEVGGVRARPGRRPASSRDDALIVATLARRLGYRIAAAASARDGHGPAAGMTARLLAVHDARRDLCLPGVWRVDRTLAALLGPRRPAEGPHGPRFAYLCLLLIQLLGLGQRCRQPVCLPRSGFPFARRRMRETCGCGHRQM